MEKESDQRPSPPDEPIAHTAIVLGSGSTLLASRSSAPADIRSLRLREVSGRTDRLRHDPGRPLEVKIIAGS